MLTIQAIVNPRLPLTAQSLAFQTATKAAVLTGNAQLVNGPSSTPPPTNTPGPTQAKQTMDAFVHSNFTRTAQSDYGLTSTANFQTTASAIMNQDLTATRTAIEANLTRGLVPITGVNGKLVRQLLIIQAHNGAISGVAFSPDGARFVSANLDNTVRVWNAQTGKPINVIPGLTKRLSVAYSPDAKDIAAGSRDNTVRMWDAANWAEITLLDSPTDAVFAVVFSADGKSLAFGRAYSTIRLRESLT